MGLVLVEAGLLDLDLSFVAEVIAFVAMIVVLGRWVYPRVMAAASARQQRITEELEAARRSHAASEARLEEAESRLAAARAQASEVLAGARGSADRLHADARQRAREDARRIVDGVRRDLEAERARTIEGARNEVADLVVDAAARVLGTSLTAEQHRELLERAIAEVTEAPSGPGRADRTNA
jgi:F-type H+-transporting ATPase subunit b